MQLKDLVKNLDIVKKIENLIQTGMLNQSIIFCCDDFVLLDQVVENICCKILGDETKVESRSHPDIQFYPTEEKKTLMVEDVQKIIDESLIKPIESDKKIFIIKNTNGMSLATQNKLLKTFEEPNKNVFYFILTKSLNGLLPTIQSRALKIRVEKLNQKQFEMLGFSTDEYLLSDANLENSKISNSDNEIFEACYNVIKSLNSSENVFNASRVMLNKKDLEKILDNFNIIFSRMIKEKLSGGSSFKDVYQAFSFHAIAIILEQIDDARQKVKFNCNSQAILDCLILKIVEEKVKWSKTI